MPKLPQHIEKLFDDKFVRKFVSTQSDVSVEDWKFLDNPPMVGSYVGPKEIKSFIATILEEERGRVVKKIEKMMNEYRMRECPIKGRMSQCTKDMCFHWTPSWENIINLIKEDE